MRILVTFSKTGALRYTGNLDLMTVWERAARRAGLPLAYSQGFHPQPKINLAAALPLGFSSRCEVADLRLKEDVELSSLPQRLQAVMPQGLGILKVESIEERAPALQTQVVSAEYEVRLREPLSSEVRSSLGGRVENLQNAASLPRERRGRAYDLRPLIEALSVGKGGELRMRLSARSGATGRPEEVLDALGIRSDEAHIERTRLIFQK